MIIMWKKVSSLTDNWSPGPKTNSVEKINALRTGMSFGFLN